MNKNTFKKSYTQFYIITKPIYEIIIKQLKDRGEIHELEKLNKNFLMKEHNSMNQDSQRSDSNRQTSTMENQTSAGISTPHESSSSTQNTTPITISSDQSTQSNDKVVHNQSQQPTPSTSASIESPSNLFQPLQSTQASIPTPSVNIHNRIQQSPNEIVKIKREKKFKCDSCNKMFTTAFSRNRHTSNFHANVQKNDISTQITNQNKMSVEKSAIPRPVKKSVQRSLDTNEIENVLKKRKSRIPKPIKKIFKDIDKQNNSRLKRKRVTPTESKIPVKRTKLELGEKRKREDEENILIPVKRKKFSTWS